MISYWDRIDLAFWDNSAVLWTWTWIEEFILDYDETIAILMSLNRMLTLLSLLPQSPPYTGQFSLRYVESVYADWKAQPHRGLRYRVCLWMRFRTRSQVDLSHIHLRLPQLDTVGQGNQGLQHPQLPLLRCVIWAVLWVRNSGNNPFTEGKISTIKSPVIQDHLTSISLVIMQWHR